MMTDQALVVLNVLSHDCSDARLFDAVKIQLETCLAAASGAPATVRVAPMSMPSPAAGARGPIVLTMRAGTPGERAFPDIAEQWRGLIDGLLQRADQPIFLCTIFRHVSSGPGIQLSSMRERIRRLNLMAAELSQATGINVIDIDRVFAQFGARALETDHLLGGEKATLAAADVIVSALLEAGLDESIAEAVREAGLYDSVAEAFLDRARTLHGGNPGVSERIGRMLAATPPGAVDAPS